MRYRIKDYVITVADGYVHVHIKVPDGDEWQVTHPIREALRLIVDETAKVVFCSSMQKDNIYAIASSSQTGYDWDISFAIPTGKTVAALDLFTIEVDWGESPEGIIPDDYAKEANATENKRKIMGADSQATWDTGVSIPAASFDSGSFNCIVRDDDKYWLGYNEDVVGTDEILVGDVCRASEADAENGYKICTNYVSPFPIPNGNVAESGDAYYLLYYTGTAFVAVEANKNYRCKEIVNLEYVPNPLQPSSTITGKLYIWEEYEGESIKDGVEEIKDFVAEEAAGINANIGDIQTLIGYTISEIDGI